MKRPSGSVANCAGDGTVGGPNAPTFCPNVTLERSVSTMLVLRSSPITHRWRPSGVNAMSRMNDIPWPDWPMNWPRTPVP